MPSLDIETAAALLETDLTTANVYTHARDNVADAMLCGDESSVRRIYRAVTARVEDAGENVAAILMVAARDSNMVTEVQFMAALRALLKPRKPRKAKRRGKRLR
jgi:hypothetical protein